MWRCVITFATVLVANCKPLILQSPLAYLDVPPFAWHTVTTDYITGLPRTGNGHNVIACFVDNLTKNVCAVPCTDTSDAVDWANMYVQHVVQHEGLSYVIISVRGPQINSNVNKALAARLGILTARHPQTDGQTERFKLVIEDVLRHFVSPKMTDWDQYLCLAQFAINNAWHETIQQTPIFLNQDSLLTSFCLGGRNRRPCFLLRICSVWLLVHKSSPLQLSKGINVSMMLNMLLMVFAVNTEVLLLTASFSLKIAGTNKLATKWIGPSRVLERIGTVAYKLDLPETMKLHNVFHVSLLEAYNRDNRIALPPPPEVIDDEPE